MAANDYDAHTLRPTRAAIARVSTESIRAIRQQVSPAASDTERALLVLAVLRPIEPDMRAAVAGDQRLHAFVSGLISDPDRRLHLLKGLQTMTDPSVIVVRTGADPGETFDMQEFVQAPPDPDLKVIEVEVAKRAPLVVRAHQLLREVLDVYDTMIKGIDAITLQALDALKRYDMARLGELMNVCQGLLNGLQVSSWELEELIQIARENGALGAKLTGGGGGGSMIALCPDNAEQVIEAMRGAGYQAMEVRIG